MKILHISDTHGFHNGFPTNRFDGIDMVIHSGDCSNYRDPYRNEFEVRTFLEWYENIPVKYKIYVAGNHDSSIERLFITREHFAEKSIIYLENDETTIEGLKIWGSPYTPTFGDWSFMKARDKISRIWETIPVNVDILIVHGPPKGIRDLSYNREGVLELCGDGALRKRCEKLIPKLVCFGHIHNYKDLMNSGICINSPYSTIYSNGSCVTDARFDLGLTSYGNIINL